jgi:hypothetical protein
MPKEMIRDLVELYDVHVGWEREKYVQVGVETSDGRSIADHLTMENGGDDEPTTPADFKGLWGTLDRTGCNRLIRVLRHARDQAFGKDE